MRDGTQSSQPMRLNRPTRKKCPFHHKKVYSMLSQHIVRMIDEFAMFERKVID